MVKGQRHIGINTNSMEESLNFYKLLGFTNIIYDVVDSSVYINQLSRLENQSLHMIKVNNPDINLTIELVKYINPNISDMSIQTIGIGHLALEVENANEMWQLLMNNGYASLTEPLLSSDGKAYVFFCYDPNGFRIEFVEILKK